jgi:hypothetical protein
MLALHCARTSKSSRSTINRRLWYSNSSRVRHASREPTTTRRPRPCDCARSGTGSHKDLRLRSDLATGCKPRVNFFESRTSRLRGDSPDSSLSNARAGGTTADPRVCRRGGVVISVTSLAPAHAHAPPRRVSRGPSVCVRLSMPPHAPSARPYLQRAPARASHEHHAVARTHACDRLPSRLLRPRRPP